MPNWVYNTLTIEGNTWDIKRLQTQVERPFTVPVQTMNMGDINPDGFPTKLEEVVYTNPVFAFWNIVSPYDMGVTAVEYALQPARTGLDVGAPNWWEETEKLRKTDKSWYSWNITNWGVKWDVAVADNDEYPDTELIDEGTNGDNHVLVYRFNTPWGIPDEALKKLSSQYPALLFTLEYEEETGWGGEHEYLRGEQLDGYEYNWMCYECGYKETGEPPYCEECDYDICPSCGWGEPDEFCEAHKKVEV